MRDDKEITITIQSGRGSVVLSFPKQTKIDEVTKKAASDLGYPEGGKYVLVRQTTGETLDPNRPIVSYQINDREILVLSEDGSGVWG